MNFRYGMVVGMDYLPPLRLMIVGPNTSDWTLWNAIVLRDEATAGMTEPWAIGQIVSISPQTQGITIIEEPE